MTASIDARVLRSRQAILEAAGRLLVRHGPSAVTHQRVAECAGIGRATVYRHWPTVEELLLEAMASTPMPFFTDPVSPYRDWIIEQVTALAKQFDEPGVLAVSTTLFSAALWDPEIDGRRREFATVLSERLAHALDAAQQEGEVALLVDPTNAAAIVLGPTVYRAIVEHLPTDPALIRHVVATLGKWTADA